MSRFNLKHNYNKFDDDDEEETLFERKALIDDDEDYDADTSEAQDLSAPARSNARIRKRQLANNNTLISLSGNNNINNLHNHQSNSPNVGENGEHELTQLDRTKRINGYIINEPNVEYTYYNIQKDDTLQGICLRYACPIALVKRINGLMTDQDFYGLTRIKLPLGKLGLLEDILRQNGVQDGVTRLTNTSDINELSFTQPGDMNGVSRPRFVNSPGTALSVSSSTNRLQKSLPNSQQQLDTFDRTEVRIDDPDRSLSAIGTSPHISKLIDHHAYSFPSLSQLNNGDVNIIINRENNQQLGLDRIKVMRGQTFISSEIKSENIIDADDLQAARHDNVQKVFEDLDFHVGKAKEAAETYDQRATTLVQEISSGQEQFTEYSQTKVSKIPQLFRCNENFGLSQTKLFSFIIIVCLILPLLYMFCRPNKI